MKLTFEQIKAVTKGAARITEEANGVHFYRFTEYQDRYYSTQSDFYYKTFGTAGIVLEFVTDSSNVTIETENTLAASRKFVFYDIYANGTLVAHMGSRDTAVGIFGGKYKLPDGTKTLQIYFPWGSAGVLRYLELDDGSSVIPTTRPNRMLMFGDSITQGYDSLYPSHSYATVLADHLNADARNKGVGGDCFCPGLIDEEETTNPDYITVAYGTNDWYSKTPDEIENNAREFYGKLSKLYPNAKIFAITPIWRIGCETTARPGGIFTEIASLIRRVTEELANVTVIDGFNLVPHDPKLFLDGGLHPAESGFAYYAERLFAKIKEHI